MDFYFGDFYHASLAQLVEQQPFKLMVAGSIPARRTKIFSILDFSNSAVLASAIGLTAFALAHVA